MNAARAPSTTWRRVGTSTSTNWTRHARGGGSGTSRVRKGYATSLGRSGTNGTDSGRMISTTRIGGAGGSVIVRSCFRPLHESADIDGPGHDDFSSSPPVAQHDERLLSAPATAVPQHDLPHPPSHEPSHTHEGSWIGRVAMPSRSSPLIRATHMTQWALPGFTAFAAAIHCSSLNSTTGGGITPLEIAQRAAGAPYDSSSASSTRWPTHTRSRSSRKGTARRSVARTTPLSRGAMESRRRTRRDRLRAGARRQPFARRDGRGTTARRGV